MSKCLECGKPTQQKHLCKDCKNNKFPPVIIKIEIQSCKDCELFRHQGVWKEKKHFLSALKNKLKNKYSIDSFQEEETEKSITLEGESTEKNNLIAKIKINKTLCKRCERQRSSYYSTILQLRNSNKDIKKYTLEFLKKQNAIISKILETKAGVDIYIDKKKTALVTTQKLKAKYGGVIKISSKLFSFDRQRSKKIYRDTVLFKTFPLCIGETFEFKGDTYTVKDKTAFLICSDSNNKKKKISYHILEKAGIF